MRKPFSQACITFAWVLAGGMFLILPRPAHALIYLPENTLESMLVRSDAIVIGTVTEVTPATNRGGITVEETLKGNATGAIAVTGVTIRVDTKTQKPRFKKDDRIVVFLGPANAGMRPILHSQTLANEAEVRTMKGCIAEITPVAQMLTDLADVKKEIKTEALRGALLPLVGSKNAYTQILMGRILSKCMSQQYAPDGWEDVLAPALASKRKELAMGALTWAAKYQTLPQAVRKVLVKVVAESEDEEVKKLAAEVLKK